MSANSSESNSESSFVVRLALFISSVEFCGDIESFLTERVPAMGLAGAPASGGASDGASGAPSGGAPSGGAPSDAGASDSPSSSFPSSSYDSSGPLGSDNLAVACEYSLQAHAVYKDYLALLDAKLEDFKQAEGIKDDAEFRDRCEEAAGEDAACDQFLSFLVASWEFEAFVKLAKDFLKELTAKFERLPETTGAGEVDLDNLPDGDLEDDDGNILDVPSPKTHALSDERLADDVANLGL